MWTAYFVGIAAVFDFFDGMAARALNVQSKIGKELDSLADVIAFGLVPGLIMFKLIGVSFIYLGLKQELTLETRQLLNYIPYLGFMITLFAAYRLGRYNLQEDHTDSFSGMPSPAAAILIASLPLIIENQDLSNEFLMESVFMNPIFPIATTILISLLMVSRIQMFSLKFKNFSFGDNKMRYIFLVIAIGLIIPFKFLGLMFTMILYIFLSLLNKALKLS